MRQRSPDTSEPNAHNDPAATKHLTVELPRASITLPVRAWLDQDLARALLRAATGVDVLRLDDGEWIDLVRAMVLAAEDGEAAA